MTSGSVDGRASHVLAPDFDRAYPLIVRGDGVWWEDAAGRRYLDAMSGGSMAATLGSGRADLIAAARAQATRLPYAHNERLTNPAQEQLARELIDVAPRGFGRVKFMTGGAEANETAIRMARAYHVERGEPERWQIVSPAQAYHGPTLETLALTGRSGLHGSLTPYLPEHLHIPPSTWRFDPTGEAALATLDEILERAGPGTVAAFFCEAVSAAALPAYSPPTRFWEGLAERRERHGFLIVFDEVVTGMGRTGDWFAASALPIVPDIIATAKGLGAGYAAIGAVLCTDAVYEAFAHGSRQFTLGHTWDGAPLPCAVGLAVMNVLRSERMIERVHDRGPQLRDELERALDGVDLVREVRGHGYLLGVEYVDPRDGRSFLPRELRVAGRIDDTALAHRLITLSTQPTRDGYAGDQSLFAPAFTSTDDELAEMVARFAAVVRKVAADVDRELDRRGPTAAGGPTAGRDAPAAAGPAAEAAASNDELAVGGRRMRALIVQHEAASPGGYIQEWLRAQQVDVDVLHIYREQREVRPAEYDLIVSLGSEFAAYDDTLPWVGREMRLMTEATTSDVPVLGVCFGAQLLARALGGRVFKAEKSEIGWLPVETREPGLVTPGPWFQWHFDTFEAPPGAMVIAESDVGPQAYVIGRSLGVQFHPEVTAGIMEDWVATYRHELDAEGVEGRDLLRDTVELSARTTDAAQRLLEQFFATIAHRGRWSRP